MSLFRLAALCVAVTFPLALAPVAGWAQASYGALYLSTLPSGANVWIDGTFVGRTPVLVDPLTRGHHVVTLTKTGWSAQEVGVDVSTGVTNMASFRMHPRPRQSGDSGARGSVAFRGLDSGAHVVIDGNPVTVASGASVTLATGSHVAVVNGSAKKISRTFTVYPDTTTQVLLAGSAPSEGASAIVAPAEEYLPDDAYHVEGTHVVVKYGGHQVIAEMNRLSMRFDNTTVSYDAAPTRINGRLYLPLALLTKLTDPKTK